jgi:hypothetical protein
MNYDWPTFLASIGGSAVVGLGAAYAIVQTFFKKKIETEVQSKYDEALANLNAKNLQELEGFKAEYQKVLDENQVLFSEYHLKRIEYLEECFDRLTEAHVAVYRYCDVNGENARDQEIDRENAAKQSFENFYIYFQKKQIFMQESTSSKFEKCFREMQQIFSSQNYVIFQKKQSWQQIEFPDIRGELKALQPLIDEVRKCIKQEVDPNHMQPENNVQEVQDAE